MMFHKLNYLTLFNRRRQTWL